MLDAKTLGADLRSYTGAVGVVRDLRGRVAAVRVVDELSGQVSELATRTVVVAAGPWSDRVLADIGVPLSRPLLRPTKGVHIVVDHARMRSTAP